MALVANYGSDVSDSEGEAENLPPQISGQQQQDGTVRQEESTASSGISLASVPQAKKISRKKAIQALRYTRVSLFLYVSSYYMPKQSKETQGKVGRRT